MFRTDHCYPPTVRAPLDDSPVFDFHFEAIAMPAPLPPTIEPLPPSPRRTNNPPVPRLAEPHSYGSRYLLPNTEARAHARKAVYILQGVDQQGRQATGVHVRPQPPSRVPWLGLVVSVALFAVGYLLGRWLP